MDVTCNRCGTSYEFEEGLVSTTGTTVKCTQCGHLFKVHRGSDGPTAPATAPTAPTPAEPTVAPSRWRVRRTDGSLHTLESLSELTRLIAVGQFRRDDELSRTGQIWKRLGEISELEALFDGGGQAGRTSDPPAPPGLPPPPSGSDRRGLEPRPNVPPPRTRRSSAAERFEVMGSAVELESSAGEAAHAAAAAPASPRASVPVPSPPLQAFAAQPLPDELDVLTPAPPRPRLWLWVVLVSAAVAGAGGAVTQILGRTQQSGSAAPSISALVAKADAALAAHRPERFEEAITLYRRALPSAPDDAHLLGSLSRAYAQYSQALRTHTEVQAVLRAPLGLAAPAQEDPESVRLANEAKVYGQRAAQRNPGNEEAGVALSDALRLAGNLVASRAEIDRVRLTQRVPDAERLRVEALLAIDEAHGRISAGRKLAALAVAHDPRSIAARLLLARCLAHENDFAGSATQLAAVREIDPALPALSDHEAELAALRAHPVRRPPPTRAPSARDADTTRAAPSPKPAPPAPAPKPAAPASTDVVAALQGPAFNDATELARKGERLLESGSVSAAKDAFEAALAKLPGMPRARTGLGYVHLERGQVTAALGQFRAAAAAGHPDAAIGLGDTYRRLGRLDDALRTYKGYLKRFPSGARRSIAEHQIELLQEQLGARPPTP